MSTLFGCIVFFIAPVGALRSRAAQRVDIPPCHVFLEFSHLANHSTLAESDHVPFFEARGCRAQLAESVEAVRKCSEAAQACITSNTAQDSNNYMCCDIQYLSRGGPALTTMFGENLNIWKLGLQTLIQIPKERHGDEIPKLLVQAKVEPYAPHWEAIGCESGRISEVTISGSSVGESNLTLRSGSVESTTPFAVRVGRGDWQELSWQTVQLDQEISFLSDPSFTVAGKITADDPDLWGPDARVTVQLGGLSLNVFQHTSGRAASSKVMLDVSVSGTFSKSSGVGGWLGSDGASLAQGQEPASCMTLAM